MREGDEFAPDQKVPELSTLQAVQGGAARSLADMARDAVRKRHDGAGHKMAIEVRYDDGPVLVVKEGPSGGAEALPLPGVASGDVDANQCSGLREVPNVQPALHPLPACVDLLTPSSPQTSGFSRLRRGPRSPARQRPALDLACARC
jgi:uncharacterized protein DUF6894